MMTHHQIDTISHNNSNTEKMTIENFKKQAKIWERKFWISTCITCTLIIVAYIFFKKDINWNDPVEWISLVAITLVGVVGSFASTYSYFFAIRIAYDGILSSQQSEVVINRLDALLSQTAIINAETNKLTRNIADSTQKTIIGLEQLLSITEFFLQESEYADELFVLWDTVCKGDLIPQTTENKALLKHYTTNIQTNLVTCAKHVKNLHIATLSTQPNVDDNELLNQYLKPLAQHYQLNVDAAALQQHLQKHHAIINKMKQHKTVKVFDITNLPFQFMIRRKGNDYTGLFTLVGSYNFTDTMHAQSIFIEHNEGWLNSLTQIFKQITHQQ